MSTHCIWLIYLLTFKRFFPLCDGVFQFVGKLRSFILNIYSLDFVSTWCHLTCSSIPYKSEQAVVRSKGFICFWLFGGKNLHGWLWCIYFNQKTQKGQIFFLQSIPNFDHHLLQLKAMRDRATDCSPGHVSVQKHCHLVVTNHNYRSPRVACTRWALASREGLYLGSGQATP